MREAIILSLFCFSFKLEAFICHKRTNYSMQSLITAVICDKYVFPAQKGGDAPQLGLVEPMDFVLYFSFLWITSVNQQQNEYSSWFQMVAAVVWMFQTSRTWVRSSLGHLWRQPDHPVNVILRLSTRSVRLFSDYTLQQ
jgi:hypothetical protein